MARAFVAVGSNINPAANVQAAVRALAARVQVAAISTVYLTEPENRPDQPPFYNCVVEINAAISPRSLKFRVLRRIEAELGRERTADKYAPRTIDLDLILYDDVVLKTPGLVLPDPDIARRAFLAVPLSELAPDLVPAGTRTTVGELAARLRAVGLRPLRAYTRRLRSLLAGRQTDVHHHGQRSLRRARPTRRVAGN